MKTSYIVGAIVVVVVIVGGIWWYMGQSSTPSPIQQPITQQTQTVPQNSNAPANNQTAPPPSATPISVTSPKPVNVAISNMAFSPRQISVKVGTKVTWTNSDGVAHTVTSNNGAFDSGTLSPGNAYSFVFNTPGTFSYHCTIHP